MTHNRPYKLTLANRSMHRLSICGSGHSSLRITSKHWFSCVNTSTTLVENNACSELFWNWNMQFKHTVMYKKPDFKIFIKQDWLSVCFLIKQYCLQACKTFLSLMSRIFYKRRKVFKSPKVKEEYMTWKRVAFQYFRKYHLS